MSARRFGFRVVSDRPYEIVTEGSVEACGWPAAVRRAVKSHLDDMKVKGRSRKRNTYMTVRIWAEGKSDGEPGG